MNLLFIIADIIILTLIIYCIKNFSDLKKHKFYKLFSILIIVLMSILTIFFISKKIIHIKNLNEDIKWANNQKKDVEEFDKKLVEEENLYNELISKEYTNKNPSNPYEIEGFKYVEGEWDSGYVIKDEDGNEYVWVPCEDIRKINFNNMAMFSKDETYNENVEEFLTSVLTYGGFYISRFEIGKENDKAVSKKDVPVYANVTQKEAKDIVSKMYNNVKCELINGYAYDCTLDWLRKTNDIIPSKANKGEVLTGREKYNNIYDVTDNVLEYTSEIHFNLGIARGIFDEKIEDDECRYGILPEQTEYMSGHLLTFRSIIYK